MNTFVKKTAILLFSSLVLASGAAMAAMQQSAAEKEALIVYPNGKIESTSQTTDLFNRSAWEVKIKDKQGNIHTMLYDMETGRQMPQLNKKSS